MTKKNHLFFLDSARGLCMLLVILGHIWETDEPLPVLIYSFHIPLFFIISGILLCYTQAEERSIGQILLSRLRGLIIPYVFFEAVFVILYEIMYGSVLESWNVGQSLLLNPLNVPLWFLPTLFVTELAFLLLLKAEKKFLPSSQEGKVTGSIIVLLYLIPFFAKNEGGLLMAAALRCCTSIGFIALGYAGCGFILEKEPHPFALAALLILDAAAALWNGKTGIYKLVFGNPAAFTFCAAAGSYLVLSALKHTRIRFLEWIGNNTLVILGLHILVLRAVQRIPGLDTDGIIGGLIAMVLICILLIPAEIFMNRFTPVLAGKKDTVHSPFGS